MPSGGIDIELCISGFSNTANYNIKGLFDYARSSNVVPAALGTNYDSSGSFEATENVFTQSVSADAGYYFPDQPTISLSIGDNARYTSSFSNDTDINGDIIIRELRKIPGYVSIPIYAITIHDEPDILQLLIDAGSNNVLIKPVNDHEIFNLLNII